MIKKKNGKNVFEKNYKKMFHVLKDEKIETWFDLGLFLDRIRDNRKEVHLTKTCEQWKKQVCQRVGFITFDFGIDGVSVEITKYAKAFEKVHKSHHSKLLRRFKKSEIFLIGGYFSKEMETLPSPNWKKICLHDIGGFAVWDGYKDYFFTHLQRGSNEYRSLAKKVWSQIIKLTIELGKLIVDNQIELLIPVNVMSNPGNVSLAYSLVLITELMDVPAIGNMHDFYWEDGMPKGARAEGNPSGIRDHFFENYHLGEVFSLIEMLYPWNSERWFYNTINSKQKHTLFGQFGYSPASIDVLPTAIDTSEFKICSSSDERENILYRIQTIFSKGEKILFTKNVHHMNEGGLFHGTKGIPLLLGDSENVKVNLLKNNLLFVQPTRVLKRKRIEKNFFILEQLLNEKSFNAYFKGLNKLTITLLVTGPLAHGQKDYFAFLLKEFEEFLNRLPEEFRSRVVLAFTFGLENNQLLKSLKLKDLRISEVYSVASLVVLPSITEGRGLPIIEAASLGVPCICNRFRPEHVFSEVIGERLDESKRLKVFEFQDDHFSSDYFEKLANVFVNPHSFTESSLQNMDVVKKRFSMHALVKTFDKTLDNFWVRINSDPQIIRNIKSAFSYHNKHTKYDDLFEELVLCKRRKYLAGTSLNEFMIYLKSLIDPSSFRIEEIEVKARAMRFAEHLIKSHAKSNSTNDVEIHYFYKHVDKLFVYHHGNNKLAIDHSFSYRHRNRRNYPYRKITEQELYGVIGILFRMLISEHKTPQIKELPIGVCTDLKQGIIERLTSNGFIKIDDSDRLVGDLSSNKPIAYFPGKFIHDELNIIGVNAIKARLGHPPEEEFSINDLNHDNLEKYNGITVFVREEFLDNYNYDSVIHWIKTKASREIQLLYRCGLIKVVPTKLLSIGVHLAQLGKHALTELLKIKNEGGFVVAFGESSFMLDMIDMPSYRMSFVRDVLFANFMGLSVGDAFVQWVPPGLKPSLAYPTPIQTPLEFHQVFKSDLYGRCVDKLGEDEVLKILKEDADNFGNPVKEVLAKIVNAESSNEAKIVESTEITGMYEDGLPWSGSLVKVPLTKSFWKFVMALPEQGAQTVVSLVSDYEQKSKEKVTFAWNGGYMLNAELVGKLGLPEEYIGSPLGLLCSDGVITSLPAYNKAAFVTDINNNIELKRVNLFEGLTVIFPNGKEVEFSNKQRNNEKSKIGIYYDLFHDSKFVDGKDRIIYRLAGNKIVEIIKDAEKVKVIPVGIMISLPIVEEIEGIQVGDQVGYEIPGLVGINNAIEAGPMLVINGKVKVDMDIEGFKTENSIKTQAARLDYLDMRGPKMGAGITKDKELILIAINGRIRESVGATHLDLASILIEYGAVSGMGFDPGGSVTLVLNGKQLNISPYNKNYEQNVYTMPGEPRGVGNAILGINDSKDNSQQ